LLLEKPDGAGRVKAKLVSGSKAGTGCAEVAAVGGRGWGLRCHCHLADTKQVICPCGIKPWRQERTSHAQERKEEGQRGVKKIV